MEQLKENFKIPKNFVNWFLNFLDNRTQIQNTQFFRGEMSDNIQELIIFLIICKRLRIDF